MPRPNILWICSDQQRWDTLGCYGNPFVRTPVLDELARSGVVFDLAFSQSPVCTPSRASFLTGRYPRTTRARQNAQDIPPDEVLVTRLLRDAGYTCGLSGKLHLSGCDPRVHPTAEPRIDDGYDEFHWSHHPRPDWPTSAYGQWLRDRGVEYDTPPREDCRYVLHGMPTEHHQTTWCCDRAINLIRAHQNLDRPWEFSINMFDPHHAFDPPRECLQPYLDRLEEIPLPNYQPGELDGKPVFQRMDHNGAYNSKGNFAYDALSDRDHRLIRAAYWAMCDLVDQQVGRVLDALDETGQREDTLVIFTSDHGEMLGDHGIYLKGPYFYECAIHVPLILSWPGVIEGDRRSHALVELTDLAPTLLDAVGLERHPGMQGISLWPLLTGERDLDTHREDVYCEYYYAMPRREPPAPYLTMVRTRQHKLVVSHGQQTGELYDLETDPTETRNLWASLDHTQVKTELLVRLCDRMAWTVDPLPPRQGAF